MMLSACGYRGEAARCKELGIAAYLTKPILQPDLREAIAQALQMSRHKAEPASLITRHTLREQRTGLHVLLVEDNAVNLRLAEKLLQKQGHQIVTARNGSQAVEALAKERFDLLLTDVQMPEMDGFDLAVAIRTGEKETGVHLPIIAMTAHAMKGDRERCIAAGMDAYLSKPVRAAELYDTIDSVLARFLEKPPELR